MSKLSRHSQEDSPKRKTRKDKTSAETTGTIVNFFRQGDISTNLPDSKRIKSNLEERRVLNKTLKETYREYRERCGRFFHICPVETLQCRDHL